MRVTLILYYYILNPIEYGPCTGTLQSRSRLSDLGEICPRTSRSTSKFKDSVINGWSVYFAI